MKALIFNSGVGKRMGHLTENCPKCMVKLYNGETIFERQIRLLQEAGIKEIIVTTGPYADQLESITLLPCFSNIKFTLVNNPLYDKTNYIYSMYLARKHLNDDFLIMHGDLVFDRKLIKKVIDNENKSLGLINKKTKLPEKDFKARVFGGKICEVGIHIFDDNCFAFQPLYKLDKETLLMWVKSIEFFVDRGDNNVYAENALNTITNKLNIKAINIGNHFINEIDNEVDLSNVSKSIEQYDFKYQHIYKGKFHKDKFKELVNLINIHNPLVVASNALIDSLEFKEMVSSFDNYSLFLDFEPNPKYESVIRGIELFKKDKCDSIISIGGGSCIDVAKNIKLCISKIDSGVPLIKETYIHNRVRHICFPTTCGTGSESTQHSVLYLDGIKQSIKCSSSLPEYVYLIPDLVMGLPLYQKKATSLDAFSQCIESFWAKQGNRISRKYATQGIRLFLKCYKSFLKEDKKAVKDMQIVANLSGKAINIGSTTAPHALSYSITSKCGLPHGHAVACCLKAIIYLLNDKDALINQKLINAFGVRDRQNFYEKINTIFNDYELKYTINLYNNENIAINFARNVNKERLTNFIYPLSYKKIVDTYSLIFI